MTHEIGEKIGHFDKRRAQSRKRLTFYGDGAAASAMVLLTMPSIVMPPAGAAFLVCWTPVQLHGEHSLVSLEHRGAAMDCLTADEPSLESNWHDKDQLPNHSDAVNFPHKKPSN